MQSYPCKNYLDVRIGPSSKNVVVLTFNSPVEVRQTSLIINNVRVPTGTEVQFKYVVINSNFMWIYLMK